MQIQNHEHKNLGTVTGPWSRVPLSFIAVDLRCTLLLCRTFRFSYVLKVIRLVQEMIGQTQTSIVFAYLVVGFSLSPSTTVLTR